jgi:hypothetical protein
VANEVRQSGTMVVAVVLLIIGATALGLGWFAAFGMAWEQRPVSITGFALLSGLIGAVFTIRALVMIVARPGPPPA